MDLRDPAQIDNLFLRSLVCAEAHAVARSRRKLARNLRGSPLLAALCFSMLETQLIAHQGEHPWLSKAVILPHRHH